MIRLIRALLGQDDRIFVYDYSTESAHGTWEARLSTVVKLYLFSSIKIIFDQASDLLNVFF